MIVPIPLLNLDPKTSIHALALNLIASDVGMYSNSLTGSFNENINAFNIDTNINNTDNEGDKLVTITAINNIIGKIIRVRLTPRLCTKKENPKNDTKKDIMLVS